MSRAQKKISIENFIERLLFWNHANDRKIAGEITVSKTRRSVSWQIASFYSVKILGLETETVNDQLFETLRAPCCKQDTKKMIFKTSWDWKIQLN